MISDFDGVDKNILVVCDVLLGNVDFLVVIDNSGGKNEV